jgi:hypothetical protein
MVTFPSGTSPWRNAKTSDSVSGRISPKGGSRHLGLTLLFVDIVQYYLLVEGAHLLVLTKIKKPPISYRLTIILQEKEYFCLTHSLTFQAAVLGPSGS